MSVATLTLNQKAVLTGPFSRGGFYVVQFTIRILPCLVLYGGTLALIMCVLLRYRWGVLMSMLLYTIYMFVQSWELVIFGAWGVLQCWINMRNNWYAMYLKEVLQETSSPKHRRDLIRDSPSSQDLQDHFMGSTGASGQSTGFPSTEAWLERDSTELLWTDVFHIVMIPNYKTPVEVLKMAIHALEHFPDTRSNMALCLAFEQREVGADQKARELKEEFGTSFAWITATYHPPDLPGHIPGKSSNECWAFQELRKELKEKRGIDADDPRVVITVIDDDSELHENYFSALTYHYVKAEPIARLTTIWQPPIVHFKNFLQQPFLSRLGSLFATLHELTCLANPIDCHVPFSSYSLSLVLANSVNGWDPDFISEDWHMYAKCSLMSEGRVRTKPIFLPLMNYAPEEDTYWGSLKARFEQACRHALGVSEVVYVVQNIYVGMIETGSIPRAIAFFWRMFPVMGKYFAVHFQVGTLAIWPMLSHLLINIYMWRSWCYIEDLDQKCANCCVPVAMANEIGVGEEQVVLNSWMIYFQHKANAGLAVGLMLAGGWGAFYMQLVKDRVDGDVSKDCVVNNPVLLWVRIQLEVMFGGWISALFFCTIPEWIAAFKIIFTTKFHHVVAGMVGRTDGDDDKGQTGESL